MKTAKDIMTCEVITVSKDADVLEAAKIMLSRHINGLPVVDGADRLVGIICQSDLVAQQKKLPVPSLFSLFGGYIPLTSTEQLDREVNKIAAMTVAQAMTADPVSVAPDTPVDEVASLMVDRGLYTLPVVADGRIVGVLGKEDVLRTLIEKT